MSKSADASSAVVPVKIGIEETPLRALILFYTTANGTKLRKRVMPLRSLGWLGKENCAKQLIEMHAPYLDQVCHLQVEELCFRLMDPDQLEALAMADSDAESIASTTEASEESTAVCFNAQAIEPSTDASDEEESGFESVDEELHSEAEAEAEADIFEQVVSPPRAKPSGNVATLQACLDRALFEKEESECALGSPGSVVDFMPMSRCLSTPPEARCRMGLMLALMRADELSHDAF